MAGAGLSTRPLHGQVQDFSQNDIGIRFQRVVEFCPDGGYLPVAVDVRNRGPAAKVEFRAVAESQSIIVSRSFDLLAGAETQFTFLVPLVQGDQRSTIQVHKDGIRLDEIEYSIGDRASGLGTGAWLVIAERVPNRDSWEHWRLLGWGGRMGSSNLSWNTLRPDQAFDDWLAYTPFEVVAVDARDFAGSMDEGQRDSLLRWVATGGSLYLYHGGKVESGLEALDKTIDWERRCACADDWERAQAVPQRFEQLRAEPIEDADNAFDLSNDPELILTRQLMLGRVVVNGGSLFDRDEQAWFQYSGAITPDEYETRTRLGVNSRLHASDFIRFVNKDVQAIPVFGFVVLITLFCIAIGPVNYLWLRRRNRIGWLLWTTPAAALGASLLLIGWSTVSNGTTTRVRLRSFTVLDQGTQSAVSLARVAVFPAAAGGGTLEFSPQTAVYPIWPSFAESRAIRVDWTDTQQWSGDLLRSNNRSQYLLVTPRTMRGRVEIESEANTKTRLRNGLEWKLKSILVRDHEGNLWFASDVDAGAAVPLAKATGNDIESVMVLARDQSLDSPIGRMYDPSSDLGYGYRYYYYGWEDYEPTTMDRSLLDRSLFLVTRDVASLVTPGSWLAVVSESPDLNIGLQSYQTSEELHVMQGFFDE